MPMPAEHMHHAAAVATEGSLYLNLLFAGLAGGMTHCAGMCGPFVIAQTAAKLDSQPLDKTGELTRLRGALLLPYHAGRITVYAFLGFMMALFAAPFRGLPWFNYISAGLLILAGIMFLMGVFPLAMPRLFALPAVLPAGVANRMRGLFARPTGVRGYALGVALGFLPCGFLYASLMAAAAQGQPLTAAIGMVIFGLGTVPALFITAAGACFAAARLKVWVRYLFLTLMIFNSLALFLKAGALLK